MSVVPSPFFYLAACCPALPTTSLSRRSGPRAPLTVSKKGRSRPPLRPRETSAERSHPAVDGHPLQNSIDCSHTGSHDCCSSTRRGVGRTRYTRVGAVADSARSPSLPATRADCCGCLHANRYRRLLLRGRFRQRVHSFLYIVFRCSRVSRRFPTRRSARTHARGCVDGSSDVPHDAPPPPPSHRDAMMTIMIIRAAVALSFSFAVVNSSMHTPHVCARGLTGHGCAKLAWPTCIVERVRIDCNSPAPCSCFLQCDQDHFLGRCRFCYNTTRHPLTIAEMIEAPLIEYVRLEPETATSEAPLRNERWANMSLCAHGCSRRGFCNGDSKCQCFELYATPEYPMGPLG